MTDSLDQDHNIMFLLETAVLLSLSSPEMSLTIVYGNKLCISGHLGLFNYKLQINQFVILLINFVYSINLKSANVSVGVT